MMMAEKIQKLNKGLVSFLGTILILIPALSLAIDATLYGEVTDDGGDPNLLVWFEYGENSSLGYQTQIQKKYGTGEFTATISNLKPCKTYYYRACVRHENQNDTSCGEIKTFTTKCEGPSVDLKVNGRDDLITVDEGASVTLSWTSSNANRCQAFGAWSGSKPLSGSETISNLTFGTKTFTLTCYGEGGSTQDSVSVFVRKVLGTQTSTEVLASATQAPTGFADSILFSFFLPSIFAISLIFALKEKILKFEEFLEKRKIEYRAFKAQKILNSKIKEHNIKKWLQ
jgi:hypothetical protein